jgi:uncharacterized protein YkwD
MKVLGLIVLGSLAFSAAAARAESLYEPLVIVHPGAIVIAADEARRLVSDVNRVRMKHAIARVTVDPELSHAAVAYARDMATRKFFGHFSPDGRSLPDRLATIGYGWTVAEENIALGANEREANEALLESPDHRANILDPRVRKIGTAALRVGVGATIYVEEFARPANISAQGRGEETVTSAGYGCRAAGSRAMSAATEASSFAARASSCRSAVVSRAFCTASATFSACRPLIAASATPSSSIVVMWRSSSPTPKAAKKSCAIGPTCRMAGSSVR